jgi:hypothetical protein
MNFGDCSVVHELSRSFAMVKPGNARPVSFRRRTTVQRPSA